MSATPPAGGGEIRDLNRKLRGFKWLVLWALLLGLGIGFYIGYVLGLDVGRAEIPVQSE